MYECALKMEVIEIFETPIRRVVRDRSNPYEDFSDEEFKNRFRFRKETVLSLMQLLSTDLEHGVSRNNFIPPILQIAATLRFYATAGVGNPWHACHRWHARGFFMARQVT